LKAILHQLGEAQNERFNAQQFDTGLSITLKNSGFEDDAQVPDWFMQFFQALASGKVLPITAYNHDRAIQGDISNFLAELEDILALRWRDEGESVELIADKLGTFGIIFIEDDTYPVGTLKAH
jgi:hypothetical protein